MQIIITGKQMEVTPRIRQYIERKAQKLSRLISPAARIEVTVTEEQTRSAKDRFEVQIVLAGDMQPVRSDVNALSVNAAFDQALDKVTAQISRHKDRQTSARRHRTAPMKTLALSRSGTLSLVEELDETEDEGQEYADGAPHSTLEEEHNEEMWTKITEIRSVPTKPMNDQEAILQLETLGLTFYPFFNEATNSVNVMYRLNDGGYGLLVPTLG